MNDLSRFVIAFLNDGRIDGKQVLSPRVIARLSAPCVDIPGDPDSRCGYRLKIRKCRGERVIEHEGTRSGYGTLVPMVPEQRFAVIILANRSGAHLSKTAEKAAEMMIALGPKPVEYKVLDMPVTEADEAGWVGTYSHPAA